MTVARSLSLIVGQAAISLSVRPQPMQRPEMGSTMQVWTQGLEGAAADMSLI